MMWFALSLTRELQTNKLALLDVEPLTNKKHLKAGQVFIYINIIT